MYIAKDLQLNCLFRTEVAMSFPITSTVGSSPVCPSFGVSFWWRGRAQLAGEGRSWWPQDVSPVLTVCTQRGAQGGHPESASTLQAVCSVLGACGCVISGLCAVPAGGCVGCVLGTSVVHLSSGLKAEPRCGVRGRRQYREGRSESEKPWGCWTLQVSLLRSLAL